MNIKFGVFWKQNLGTIYKDNSITTLGKEADVDLNLSEVSSIHANFKVDGKNYTSIVYIVDIEKGLIRIPFTREVLSIGMHELELVAVMKNGDVIPSQTFTYNIVESLDNLEDITEETNYPILIQLLQDVNSKIAEIDDAIARIPSPEELKGEKGDKGDKGEQGIQGERGLQGIQGIRGEKGDKGDRGLQGIQGVKGEKGDKGERGERGLQGIQGNQGARGIQGEKGDKGEAGVGLGFEWSGTRLGIKKDTDTSYKYVELKGAKGEQGAKGEKGDTPSIAHLEKQVADKSKELDTKFNTLTAKQQQDAEVVTARGGEVSLNARLERDLANTNRELEKIKKLEESTVTTVTSSKAFTTVAETSNGYFEDVKLEGKTLVNLIHKNYSNVLVQGSGAINNNDNTITLQANGGFNKLYFGQTSSQNIGLHSIYKPNTDYTLVLNISKNTLEKKELYGFGNVTTGIFVKKYTTPLDLSTLKNGNLIILEVNRNIHLAGSGEITFSSMLLEGDHTDKDISCFEGLKSAGQDTDEISVSSSTFEQYKLEQGAIDYQGNIASSKLALVTDFISVHQNIIYKITDKLGIGYDRIAFYDRDKNFLYRTDSYYGSKASEIKAIANSCFMKVSMYRHTPLTVENLPCIEVSTRLDKKQILYYNPTTQTWEKPVLREWDSIEKHNDGKYYYHKRSGEVVLNGSENWNDGTVQNNTIRYQCSANGIKLNANLICDKFSQIAGGTDTEGVSSHASNQVLQLTLTKDKSTVRSWLQANNVTVVYELAKEEVYECTNLDLITYSGETNLIVNSGAIQPKITLKVLSNVSNVVKLLQEKVSILENKFIKGLQQVLAGDMMSLAHLLYPEDFENTHEIQTLEL